MRPGVEEAQAEGVSQEGDQELPFQAIGGQSVKVDDNVILSFGVVDDVELDVVGERMFRSRKGSGDFCEGEGEMGLVEDEGT